MIRDPLLLKIVLVLLALPVIAVAYVILSGLLSRPGGKRRRNPPPPERDPVTGKQRREFFRIDVHLPVQFRRIDGGGLGGDWTSSETTDLSAKGLSIASPTPHPGDARMEIRLPLAEGETPFDLTARVVRSTRTHRTDRHILHLEFVDLPEEIQDRLVRFVFERQRARGR